MAFTKAGSQNVQNRKYTLKILPNILARGEISPNLVTLMEAHPIQRHPVAHDHRDRTYLEREGALWPFWQKKWQL